MLCLDTPECQLHPALHVTPSFLASLFEDSGVKRKPSSHFKSFASVKIRWLAKFQLVAACERAASLLWTWWKKEKLQSDEWEQWRVLINILPVAKHILSHEMNKAWVCLWSEIKHYQRYTLGGPLGGTLKLFYCYFFKSNVGMYTFSHFRWLAVKHVP